VQAIRYGRYSFPSPEWEIVSQGGKDFVSFMLQVAVRPNTDSMSAVREAFRSMAALASC
jgi:hypothetical protein